MVFRYAYVLPILCFVLFMCTFAITYCISVLRKDVNPIFPYISDTGNWSPESCIFALMLNLGAIIQGVIVYLRYRHIREITDKEDSKEPSIVKINKISGVLGLSAAFGVSLVGNFQETNVFVVHILGAGAAFGGGAVYLCMQSYLSFKLYPKIGFRNLNWVRVCLAAISSITYILTAVFGALSIFQFKGDDVTKWGKEDGGYTKHFISVVNEWILAISTLLFLLTYTAEFKKISIREPPISVIT